MSSSTAPLSILLAGSSAYTLQLAKVLFADPRFRITGVLTPAPQPIGRHKTLTPSPVQIWAEAQEIPVLLISEKIDQNVKKSVIEHNDRSKCDFLLVVDFGYFVPNWLLALPQLGPVNVHPSLLPRWRGSSPAQRVLLAGETESAVSVIMMTDKLDAGDIVAQLPFSVNPAWNSQAYYEFAFNLLAPKLGTILSDLASGSLTLHPQPIDSPTPMAARLSKADSYVPWQWVTAACGWTAQEPEETPPQTPQTGLLQDLATELNNTQRAQLLARATRAFSPWPKLWTLLPTPKGWQRLIIWQADFDETTQRLKLVQVQLEGRQPSTWNEIKNNWQQA